MERRKPDRVKVGKPGFSPKESKIHLMNQQLIVWLESLKK
ncbi:hypothetical protein FHS45_001312 [Thalassobacillus devorans]|nr:hypothetical protein [Thalassobacillus devorans]